MAMLAESVDGVIGVDTHRDTLTAAAVTRLGGVLAQTTTGADAAGYRRLLGFAHTQVPGRCCWAVEGRAASVPAWQGSWPSTASGSSRWVDPSGRPPGLAPERRAGRGPGRPPGAWPRPPGHPTPSR
jgi:hypothetical protein